MSDRTVTLRFRIWETDVLCRRCWLEHLMGRHFLLPGRGPFLWCPRCDK